MSEKKNLTLHGYDVPHTVLILGAIGMVAASIYLLAHYFQTFYPVGVQEGQLCRIQGFFSCDAAAYSPASAIPIPGTSYTIPNAIMGILAGSFLIISSLFPSKKLEGTNAILTFLNAAGCIFLFFYSIFILGHLCPGCTVYYIFSCLCAYLYWKFSDYRTVSIKVLAAYSVIFALSLSALFYSFNERKTQQLRYKIPILNAFYNAPEYGDPAIDSEYRNISATKEFKDAPLRITIFSDFECPYCSQLAKMIPLLKPKYEGKLNVQFFFYPLDKACNPNMTRDMHMYACKASYISSCLPKKFDVIHDEIFEHGTKLSHSFLDKIAKREGVQECMTSDKTKATVAQHIETASLFGIESTPTLIINGRKFQGASSSTYFEIILDDLLEKQKQKK